MTEPALTTTGLVKLLREGVKPYMQNRLMDLAAARIEELEGELEAVEDVLVNTQKIVDLRNARIEELERALVQTKRELSPAKDTFVGGKAIAIIDAALAKDKP